MRLQPVYDIAELCARHKVTHAVVCPGSRSAPITLGLVRHPKLQVRTVSDERSAAFIALGIAQSTQRPVVLVSTSGSASYNFAPAIAEAFFQNVPLIVITADRPTEWVGQRDGQTISQRGIYGEHVKASYHLPEDTEQPDARWSFYRMVNEALLLAKNAPVAPVHLNVPLREPLYPQVGEIIQYSHDIPFVQQSEATTRASEDLTSEFVSQLHKSQRTLIVVGQELPDKKLAVVLEEFSKQWHAPIVCDINSNLHSIERAILRADTFLMGLTPSLQAQLSPELLITLGKSTLSKNLKIFLRKHKAINHWHLEPGMDRVIDPYQSMTHLVATDPIEFLQMAKPTPEQQGSADYLQQWSALERQTRSSVDSFFSKNQACEFGWVHSLLDSIPDGCHLHLSNSLSVRYANWIGLRKDKKNIRVFCNRGTSGIDGCTSTAVGHALSSDTLNILVTGDMAFFYDRNAFWHNYSIPNLRILLLNNQGGAIFGVIDGPRTLPESAEYFITRQNSSAKWMAAEFGIAYQSIESPLDEDSTRELWQNFFMPSPTPRLLEIKSDTADAQRIFQNFKQTIKTIYES
jgi:2-succinyl-5-enolpyruvyl-6-hydroxy-3-cyclohexene-1-carboxylate synthase